MGFSKFLGDLAKNQINSITGGDSDFSAAKESGADTNSTGTPVLRDWRHAHKVFVGSDLLRAPKYKGMFHVSFVFNEEVFTVGKVKGLNNSVPRDVLSVLTKSIDLPKFSMEYSTLNAYNHTTYNYRKIKYDPINVTFHDDMADIVTTFWFFYYAYYFAEGNKTYESTTGNQGGLFTNMIQQALTTVVKKVVEGVTSLFNKTTAPDASPFEEAKDGYEAFRKYANGVVYGESSTKQIPKKHHTWGLNGSAYHLNSLGAKYNVPLLRAIEIYPLGLKKASMIVLHNPRIVSWQHDNFDYTQTTTATCQAQIVYEGVTYKDQIDASLILNDVRLYDRTASPNSSSKGRTGVLGFVEKVDGTLGKLKRSEELAGSDIIRVVSAVKGLIDGD